MSQVALHLKLIYLKNPRHKLTLQRVPYHTNGSARCVCLENPAAGLERMWFMLDWEDKKPEKVIDLCSYAWPFKKTTNLWIEGFKFEPEGSTGDGRCNNRCDQCSWDPLTKRFKHYMALAVDPGRGTRGVGAAQMTCGMPQMLIEEILAAVDETEKLSDRVVLDLCAGFQSWAPVAKKFGCKYIAIDVLGDRNLGVGSRKVGGTLNAE